MNRFYLTRSFFYGEGEGGNSPPPPPPPPPPTPPRTFTQEEVNKMLADNKRTLQEQNSTLITQLETLRAASGLTQQQKEELDARIQTLQQQHLTTEQKLKADFDSLNKKYKTDTETYQSEGKKWRSNYDNLLIENGIRAGAAASTAASADQMLMLLSNRAKVVEEVGEDGKGTGRFIAKLPMTITDPKTQKQVEVELPIPEAIAEMKKDAKNANLFMFDGRPGIGGANNGAGAGGNAGSPDFSKMSADEYAAWSKKQGMRGKR